MNISWALEQIKLPNTKITRLSWIEEKKFIWLMPKAIIKKEWIKDEMLLSIFENRAEMELSSFIRSSDRINGIITGWLPNNEDLFANDWMLYPEDSILNKNTIMIDSFIEQNPEEEVEISL